MAKRKRASKAKRTAKPASPWPKYLRALRDRLGDINQTKAGKAIGVSQNLWSAWEKGVRIPDASRQILIKMLADGKLTI